MAAHGGEVPEDGRGEDAGEVVGESAGHPSSQPHRADAIGHARRSIEERLHDTPGRFHRVLPRERGFALMRAACSSTS